MYEIVMKKLLLILCLFLMTAHAQSNLPPCTSPPFNNCYGTFTWPVGDKYVGQFTDNKLNGQGSYKYANGDKYVGQFINDNRTGQGTYTFANGNKYVGQFKDNKYDGFGTLYNTNGSIFQQGLWRDNEFVQVQSPPAVPKPPVNNAQDIKRQKCIRLGLVPGTNDFQQCLN